MTFVPDTLLTRATVQFKEPDRCTLWSVSQGDINTWPFANANINQTVNTKSTTF